jgi:hypothetical protein
LKVAGLPMWVIDAFAHEFSKEETEPKVAIAFFYGKSVDRRRNKYAKKWRQ